MEDIVNNFANYAINPSNVLGAVLDLIENRLAGDYSIVDASNPFMLALEAATVAPAGHIVYTDQVTSGLYKILATNEDDLYKHLSGPEYIGRWATPASSAIRILINYESVLTEAVALLNDPTIRKITIPDGSSFVLNNIPLSLPAPVDILVYPHDNIRVLFDSSSVTPLYPIKGNIVPNRLVLIDTTRYLELIPPLVQYKVTSVVIPLESSLTLNYDVLFPDQYCYCRVFLDLMNGRWSEIQTTHSDTVYDTLTVTAILKVTANSINVEIPLVYQTTMNLGRAIRIDVFSTKGVVNEDLVNLTSKAINVTVQDYNTFNNNKYYRAYVNISDIKYYPYQNLTGGTNGLNFTQLKQRVVYNVDNSLPPIRPTDVVIQLQEKGYNCVKLIDNLTDRVYLASGPVSNYTKNGLTVDSISTSMEVAYDEEQADENHRLTMSRHSSGRTTVLSSAVYSVDNGRIRYLTDSEIARLNSLPDTELCKLLNAGIYLFSPFHYSLDSTQVTFKARTYWLESPEVLRKDFIDSNRYTNFAISTISSSIELIDNKYRLTLTANTPNSYLKVRCQLRHKDVNMGTALYLDGTRTQNVSNTSFVFDLETSFDVDQNDAIEISSLKNSFRINVPIFLSLESTFDVYYLIESDNNALPTMFDGEWAEVFYSVPMMGATHEKITVQLGVTLSNLYVESRDSLKVQEWLRYTAPVPLYYEEDVLKRENGELIYHINNGVLEFEVLHAKGTPVLDEKGVTVYQHRAGDLILDSSGKPMAVTKLSSSTLKHVVTTLFSYKFKRANNDVDVSYCYNLGRRIYDILESDIKSFAGRLLERTNLYFKPQSIVTPIKIGVGGGETIMMTPLLSFKITYYLTDAGLNNEMVLNNIITTTRNIISNHIPRKLLSIPDIEADITKANLFSVVSFELEKFSNGAYQMLSLLSDEVSFNIRDVINVRADGKMEVNNDIVIGFKKAY